MKIVPLVLVTASQIEAFHNYIAQGLREWCQKWVVHECDASVSIAELDSCPTTTIGSQLSNEYNSADGELLVVTIQEAITVIEIIPLLLGDPCFDPKNNQPGAVTERLVRDALNELYSRLLVNNSAGSCPEKRPANFDIAGNGCAANNLYQITITLGEVEVRALTTAANISRAGALTGATQSDGDSQLASVSEAMSRQQVRVSFFLGDAELTIKELEGIRVGDVIQLDQPLNHMISMRIADSSIAISGHMTEYENSLFLKIKRIEQHGGATTTAIKG